MKAEDVKEALLEHGLEHGRLTFEELNEMLPAGYLPLDEMERFLEHLEKLGIKVGGEDCPTSKPRRRRAA